MLIGIGSTKLGKRVAWFRSWARVIVFDASLRHILLTRHRGVFYIKKIRVIAVSRHSLSFFWCRNNFWRRHKYSAVKMLTRTHRPFRLFWPSSFTSPGGQFSHPGVTFLVNETMYLYGFYYTESSNLNPVKSLSVAPKKVASGGQAQNPPLPTG